MKRPQSGLTNAILFALWGLILAWQYFEHQRVVESARQALIDRAVDISTSVGVVIRSQRRFLGIVTQDRLESALAELVQIEDLDGVSLLNAQGEVVAESGTRPHPELSQAESEGQVWSNDSVSVMNFIDIGQVSKGEGNEERPTIVLTDSEMQTGFRNLRQRREQRDAETSPESRQRVRPNNRNGTELQRTNRTRRGNSGRRPFIDPERFQELLKTQSLHRFAVVLPTKSIRATQQTDELFRLAIVTLAFLLLGGSAITWQSIVRSSELQLRLVRAKELNEYLKEMNLAAAGLAHETRNPLNLIRGMAQMISQTPSTTAEVKERTQQITNEVDRVTNQLNDFINYSKPRETRMTPVDLEAICRDVMRTLAPDIEDKSIRWVITGPSLIVDADEQMLRQVLFNLLLNATQAVEEGGRIQIRMTPNTQVATLEIEDDGPGIAASIQPEIFKPYFTSNEKGTGLGLAIVHQIALAHDWEIDYFDATPQGAGFRITRLKQSSRDRK